MAKPGWLVAVPASRAAGSPRGELPAAGLRPICQGITVTRATGARGDLAV